MNIEQLKVNAINNILSVSGKEKTSQVIREEIDKIIMVVFLFSKHREGEIDGELINILSDDV